MASTWELPVRLLLLVKQEEEYPHGFFQFMVALCLENPMGILPWEPLSDFVVESSFIEASHRTGWYFQHLPEDKLGKVDDYLEEAAEKLREDQLYNPEYHHRVIVSFGKLHLN
tara:strand:+ start:809 stop:1147 length:339 start_codon:yes stop_codon:yes gene_type:complete